MSLANRNSLLSLGLLTSLGVPYLVYSPGTAWQAVCDFLTPETRGRSELTAAVSDSYGDGGSSSYSGGDSSTSSYGSDKSNSRSGGSSYDGSSSGSNSSYGSDSNSYSSGSKNSYGGDSDSYGGKSKNSYSDSNSYSSGGKSSYGQESNSYSSGSGSSYGSDSNSYSSGSKSSYGSDSNSYSSGSKSSYGSDSSSYSSGSKSSYGDSSSSGENSYSGGSGYRSSNSSYSSGSSYGRDSSGSSYSSDSGSGKSSWWGSKTSESSGRHSWSSQPAIGEKAREELRKRKPPVYPLTEVLRFDISPVWVTSRWPRVSAGLAELDLQGYRVPFVSGTQEDDVAGSLTYYFDAQQRLARLTLRGTTGDPRKLVALCTSTFGLAREKTDDPSLVVYREKWNGKQRSELRIKQARVVRADAPHSRFEVELSLRRPSGT